MTLSKNVDVPIEVAVASTDVSKEDRGDGHYFNTERLNSWSYDLLPTAENNLD